MSENASPKDSTDSIVPTECEQNSGSGSSCDLILEPIPDPITDPIAESIIDPISDPIPNTIPDDENEESESETSNSTSDDSDAETETETDPEPEPDQNPIEIEIESNVLGLDEDNVQVDLFIYDLSNGLAKSLGQRLFGFEMEMIYHTAIVTYGREYFFGIEGIFQCPPGETILGPPTKIENLGQTHIPREVFLQHLEELGNTTFGLNTYDIFQHNCNSFSNELALFLLGRGIPDHILTLPDAIASTPLGQVFKKFYSNAILPNQRRFSGGGSGGSSSSSI